MEIETAESAEERGVSQRKISENEIAEIVIGCAIRVHKKLGPGLLESPYAECLGYEILKAGLFLEKQKPLPLIYEDVKMDCGYRLDLKVERKVIIEVKAVDGLNDIHLAQVLTYLRLSECKLGLLINFNVLRLKDGGIRRVVNNL
jgi:GxxExxY protein